MPVFDSVGGRNAIPSGLSHQNLVWTIVSLFRSSRANFDSVCVSGRFISRSLTVFHIEFSVRFSHWMSSLKSSSSYQIVSSFFSPEIHMNLQLGETSRASSPWINHQHLWWDVVWSSAKVSHVCWIWPRSWSGRSASVVKRLSFIQRDLDRSHLLDSFPFVILWYIWIQTLDGKLLEMVCSILRWSWEFTEVPFSHSPSFLLYSPGLRSQSVVYVAVIDPFWWNIDRRMYVYNISHLEWK